MLTSDNKLSQLAIEDLKKRLSEEEKIQLEECLKQLEGCETVDALVMAKILPEEVWNQYEQELEKKLADIPKKPAVTKKRKKRFLQAYIVLTSIILIYTLLFFPNKVPDRKTQQTGSVLPNKVMLHLGDGSVISLDGRSNGRLPAQGNCELIVEGNILRYRYVPKQGGSSRKQLYAINCLDIPNGKQYEVELPDGSKVWLNAASSIRFPVGDAGGHRKIELSGEAYFEIKADSTIPFTVNVLTPTELEQKVTATGTKFNINAYCDLPVIKTTLYEGTVRVESKGKMETVEPGEELQVSKLHFIRTRKDDIRETLAWKNNRFYYNDEPVCNVLKDISRWYGQPIEYLGDTSERIYFLGSRLMDCEYILDMVARSVDCTPQKEDNIIRLIPAIKRRL